MATTSIAHHVPQVGKGPKPAWEARNPYHEDCPTCGAIAGQYCQGRGSAIEGIGAIAHPARRTAANAAPVCQVCAGDEK